MTNNKGNDQKSIGVHSSLEYCVRYVNTTLERLKEGDFRSQKLVDASTLHGLTTFGYPMGLAKVTPDPRRALCFTTFQQQASAQTVGNLFWGLNVVLPLFIICLCYSSEFSFIAACDKEFFSCTRSSSHL